jgi:hypothetical protein
MRQLWIRSLVGSGLLLGALTLNAQYYPQQYQPRSDYSRYDQQREGWRNMMLNRVRSDLDNAQSRTIPFSGDRWRITRAKEALNDFQARLNSGDYDRRQLDMAINNMQRVVDSNRLPYRYQQSLSSDVNRLRDLQSRLEGGL